jgi:hypothetical protein
VLLAIKYLRQLWILLLKQSDRTSVRSRNDPWDKKIMFAPIMRRYWRASKSWVATHVILTWKDSDWRLQNQDYIKPFSNKHTILGVY